MLEDTNSLDGAQFIKKKKQKKTHLYEPHKFKNKIKQYFEECLQFECLFSAFAASQIIWFQVKK